MNYQPVEEEPSQDQEEACGGYSLNEEKLSVWNRFTSKKSTNQDELKQF